MTHKIASGDYEVGYGKPPKRSQFKRGQSGNPTGRPKGVTSGQTDIAEIGRVARLVEIG